MKICYINLTGYGLLDSKYAQGNPYGGAEVAVLTDARELATDKEFEVHLISHAENEQQFIKNNVTVWTFTGNSTDKRIGEYAKYCTRLWKKLKEINADIYVYRVAPGEIYFLIGLFCRLYRKKCVHILGTVPPRKLKCFKPVRYLRWILLLQLGLQLTHKLVALAQDQVLKLQPSLRKKVSVIYTGKKILKNKKTKRKYFLWVGRARPEKRPELLTRLAEKMPEKKFIVIGTSNMGFPKNVHCIPEVQNKNMDTYYSRAIATVSTSESEGFSNAYIESWKNGTPVIALTVDTDETICKHNLGFHSHTFEQLVRDVRRAIANQKKWNIQSRNARAYVQAHHDITRQINEYKKLFRSLP